MDLRILMFFLFHLGPSILPPPKFLIFSKSFLEPYLNMKNIDISLIKLEIFLIEDFSHESRKMTLDIDPMWK